MKKLITTVLLLTVFFAAAQNTTSLKVKESQTFYESNYASNIVALHSDKNGNTGIVRKGKRNILLDIINKDLKKIDNQFIKVSRKEGFVGEFFYENKIRLFTVFSPEKRKRVLNCYTYNLDTKILDKKVLFEKTVEKKKTLFRARNKRQTNFAVSPDGKYFVVNTDNVKKNVNSYTVRVYDSKSLELLYTNAYQTHEDRYFQPNDLFIDNDQTVYIIGKSFLSGKSQRKNRKANYTFVLNKINKDKENTLDIKLDREHIQSLSILKKGDVMNLIGFYSQQNVYQVKGSCNFIIDTNKLKVDKKTTNQLPNDVYKDLYGDKTGSKSSGELDNFGVDHILEDSKGNTYLISEKFYITTTWVNNGQFGSMQQTIYHYDDILALKLGPDGKLIWGRSIFKRSNTPSYNAFLKNDQLYLILNSGKKLSKKKDGRTKVSQGWFESSALYNIVFTESGEVSYEKIKDNKGKSKFRPYYGTYENGKFIMPNSVPLERKFMVLE